MTGPDSASDQSYWCACDCVVWRQLSICSIASAASFVVSAWQRVPPDPGRGEAIDRGVLVQAMVKCCLYALQGYDQCCTIYLMQQSLTKKKVQERWQG